MENQWDNRSVAPEALQSTMVASGAEDIATIYEAEGYSPSSAFRDVAGIFDSAPPEALLEANIVISFDAARHYLVAWNALRKFQDFCMELMAYQRN